MQTSDSSTLKVGIRRPRQVEYADSNPAGVWRRPYAARKATTLKGISSLKLDSDPLGSPDFLNDSADAFDDPWAGAGAYCGPAPPELDAVFATHPPPRAAT